MIKSRIGIIVLILTLSLLVNNITVPVTDNTKVLNDKHDTSQEIITDILENETEVVSDPIYTEDDLFNLAVAICREAGGESEEIQVLVANVIVNRVNSPIFPDTIYDVLTQRKQYGTMWRDGISFPDWATEDIKNQCYSVAKRVLEGERVCPPNVLYQAEFKQGSGVFKEYPGYYFCYY